jgi:hypothetical protein
MSQITEPSTSSIIVPRTRGLLRLKEIDIPYIIGDSKLTYAEVIDFIQTTMDQALELTITETTAWIKKYVPKRSGDLQQTLLDFLDKSRPPPSLFTELRNVRLILGVGAEVKYAKYVIPMTSMQVQHDNTWFEHSGRRAYSKGKPVLLDDPEAKGQFFKFMVAYALERFKINLSKIKWIQMRSYTGSNKDTENNISDIINNQGG